MADKEICEFCGTPLSADAKYCEECWKSLARGPNPSPQHAVEHPRTSWKRGFGRALSLAPLLTGKKRAAGGALFISFILLIVGAIVTSHLYSSNSGSTGEWASPPTIMRSPPSPTVAEAVSDRAGIPPLAPLPTSTLTPDVTVTPASASTCECLGPCINALYVHEMPPAATPSTPMSPLTQDLSSMSMSPPSPPSPPALL
jgi:hypothetical protein